MNVQAHFTPHLFEFLLELRANNDRAWFQDNKGRYEEHVKEPLLQFIADFGGVSAIRSAKSLIALNSG